MRDCSPLAGGRVSGPAIVAPAYDRLAEIVAAMA
jgi:hypothetical protein